MGLFDNFKKKKKEEKEQSSYSSQEQDPLKKYEQIMQEWENENKKNEQNFQQHIEQTEDMLNRMKKINSSSPAANNLVREQMNFNEKFIKEERISMFKKTYEGECLNRISAAFGLQSLGIITELATKLEEKLNQMQKEELNLPDLSNIYKITKEDLQLPFLLKGKKLGALSNEQEKILNEAMKKCNGSEYNLKYVMDYIYGYIKDVLESEIIKEKTSKAVDSTRSIKETTSPKINAEFKHTNNGHNEDDEWDLASAIISTDIRPPEDYEENYHHHRRW